MRKYLLNLETSKIELHFNGREEYNSLSDDLKKELRRNFIYSPSASAWVSKSTQNHYWAIQIANKLGFTEEERINERLSFEEELIRDAEKAERKIAKYDKYAENAEKRAEGLQADFNSFRGDIAFFTQPNINSASGRSFTNRRNNIINRYEKGFEEFRKSDYFKEKSKTLQGVVNGDKFNDRVYLSNRIRECNKNIRAYKKSIVWCEEQGKHRRMEDYLSKMEYEIDKLAYMENCLENIGGIKCTIDNLKIGYEIKARGDWMKVLKINTKTVECTYLKEHLSMFIRKVEYSEIEDFRVPENFIETEEIKNPFNIDDILVAESYDGERIIHAYQILKVTAKTATIKEIKIENNEPQKNQFKEGSKESRRHVKKNKYNSKSLISDDRYSLYKYIA